MLCRFELESHRLAPAETEKFETADHLLCKRTLTTTFLFLVFMPFESAF
jgi:hypothetical protein